MVRPLIATLALALAALSLAARPPAAQEIGRLGWMSGSWAGTKDGVASEEHWTGPEGGVLVGMHKDVRASGKVSFEFLRIALDAEGRICYLASPGGAPPTAFCAVELGERRGVFEYLQHDFPQRILYWLDDAGALHARVEGPERDGESAQEWTWTRVPS
jgi:hypothetical protein